MVNSHDMVFYFDEKLLHLVDVFCNVEWSDWDQESCVVEADEFAKHLTTEVDLKKRLHGLISEH